MVLYISMPTRATWRAHLKKCVAAYRKKYPKKTSKHSYRDEKGVIRLGKKPKKKKGKKKAKKDLGMAALRRRRQRNRPDKTRLRNALLAAGKKKK